MNETLRKWTHKKETDDGTCADLGRGRLSLYAKFASAILQRGGYELGTAADGQEALRKAKEERPRSVFMDAILPVQDGSMPKPYTPESILAQVQTVLGASG